MKQKWGQHFLVRERYVTRMLEAAGVEAGDHVLEVGPGRGVLTSALLAVGATVTAVEVDPKLQQWLSQNFAGEANFRLLSKDILSCAPEELIPLQRPARFVANLPYNIATAIFEQLFPHRTHWDSWSLMVQKEVAERICASPADKKAYGLLSVAGAFGFSRTVAFEVPPSAFQPPPKVDSAVVHLRPQDSGWSAATEAAFLNFVGQLFQQRRKTLMKNIQQSYGDWFASAEASLRASYGMRRPETLDLGEWRSLFEQLHAWREPGAAGSAET